MLFATDIVFTEASRVAGFMLSPTLVPSAAPVVPAPTGDLSAPTDGDVVIVETDVVRATLSSVGGRLAVSPLDDREIPAGADRMTIDKSLRVKRGATRNRSVLTRVERIARLTEADAWKDKDKTRGMLEGA